jgi:transposase
MGKRIQVAGYLTVEQLKDRYQHETDGRTRTHWQILWHIAAGKTAQEVADLTGLTVKWVREVVKRYNQHGPDGVGDQRHQNPGAPQVLTAEQEAELMAALEGPAPDGEVWTGRQVAQWISQRARRPVTSYCGWLYLRRLDCRLRVTRSRHVKANPVEQEGFKKTARHRAAGTSRASRSAGTPVGV